MNHTFVICAYKESAYLENCIKSLIDQTIKSKIILSTATPNEHIQKIANKYSIPVYTHVGSGIGKDWNCGLKMAESKYVTIAHQDDIYKKEYAEKCVQALEKNTNSLIAFSNYFEIKNNIVQEKNRNLKIKDIMLAPFRMFPQNRFIRMRVLSMGSPICCPAVTYNMEAIGNFRFSETMTVSLDWDAWYRLGKMKGRFCYIPEELMLHRIHEASETTNAIENNQRAREDMEMFCRFWPKGIAKKIYSVYQKSEETNRVE